MISFKGLSLRLAFIGSLAVTVLVFGAIRGIALSAQVLAQAAGPLLSGALRDMTGDYQLALQSFAALAALSVVAALTARQPRAWRPS